MDAFDKLVGIFESGLDPRFTAEESAQSVLDEHARELANKIRSSDKLRNLTDDHMHDVFAAADLIDPDGGGR
jgi:hypothetical protein